MHELVSAGAMGSRMKATNLSNSIAVCGQLGTEKCHGLLQRHEISFEGDAEKTLTFTARTAAAQQWMEAA